MRPSEIMLLVVGVVIALVGVVLGIGVFFDHTRRQVLVLLDRTAAHDRSRRRHDPAGGRLLGEGRAARDQGSPAQ